MGIWHRPKLAESDPISTHAHALRPLDGASSLFVENDATMSTSARHAGGSSLVWSVYTNDGWRRLRALAPRQELEGLGTLVTSVGLDNGHIRFASGAGVAGGAPVGVVEVTNTTSTPLAVGVDIDTPETTQISNGTLWVGSRPLLTSWLSPRTAPEGRSDGAEPALLVPVPHGATARFSIPLGVDAPWISNDGKSVVAVPTLADIQRGWEAHLARGLRFDIGGDERWGAGADRYLHAILTSAPHETRLEDVTAAALYGFGLPVSHVSAALDRADTTAGEVLVSLGTWNRLHQASTLASDEITEQLVVAVAKAAHHVDRSAELVPLPLGAGSRAITQLSRSMDMVGQPDIAERLVGLAHRFGAASPADVAPPSLSSLDAWRTGDRDGSPNAGSRAPYLVGLRQRLVDSRNDGAAILLVDLETAWRGRAIEVFKAPIGDTTLAYGLRWHGARPALLWSLEATQVTRGVPMLIQVPAIDPSWTTSASSGEVLLADPGWSVS